MANRVALRQVKPILSLSPIDAHRRVITLYKTWYRQIPFILSNYDVPVTKEDCILKLREEFKRHANVKDIRVIDMLLIKGQMELQETCAQWKPAAILMNYWKVTQEPKPKDFLSKFISGHD
ncbi:NADH dehydrogenase [ubiquinone] 1 alpha subcomplex subunit 6 [Bombus vosnesenskii]|uniref:NADH dehydrogenase [ubiquinone] 1 alpha subcomplex subunit 6 n=1 Tax=Bombus vosnesenskii TaxID=207650 RepID=A0A6J3KMY7_9HYME|nr:NADH dehydrogenase [ubiquinone] 1 alpha subcomplex subunit 6 [Bombus vosnesenskii]XP_050471954.1 NADH dehydrogenase [ubiquinone] 1 alpha subcomplex subunit 6 [Bombus huntii]